MALESKTHEGPVSEIKWKLAIGPSYVCANKVQPLPTFLIMSLSYGKCIFLIIPKKDSFGVQPLTLTPGGRGQDKSMMTQHK